MVDVKMEEINATRFCPHHLFSFFGVVFEVRSLRWVCCATGVRMQNVASAAQVLSRQSCVYFFHRGLAFSCWVALMCLKLVAAVFGLTGLRAVAHGVVRAQIASQPPLKSVVEFGDSAFEPQFSYWLAVRSCCGRTAGMAAKVATKLARKRFSTRFRKGWRKVWVGRGGGLYSDKNQPQNPCSL